MNFSNLLIIALVIVLLATLPVYPYSQNWGYSTTGVIALVLLILFLLNYF